MKHAGNFMNWLRIGSWIVWVDIFLYKRAIRAKSHFAPVYRNPKALGSSVDLFAFFQVRIGS